MLKNSPYPPFDCPPGIQQYPSLCALSSGRGCLISSTNSWFVTDPWGLVSYNSSKTGITRIQNRYLRWSSLILTPNVHRLSLLLDLAVLRLSFPAFLRQPWFLFCYEWSLQACYGAPGAGCGGSRDQLGPSDKFKTNSASTVCWGGSSCHEIMSWYQRSYETCDELRCVVTIMKLCQVIHDSEDKNVTLWSIPRLLPPSSSPSSPGYVASLWRSAESHTKYPSCHHRKLTNKTSKSAQSQSLCYPPPSLYLYHGDSQALILTAGFSSDKI